MATVGENVTVTPAGMNTEHYVAGCVLFALLALWGIKKGFRGASFGGASVSVG